MIIPFRTWDQIEFARLLAEAGCPDSLSLNMARLVIMLGVSEIANG